MAQLLVRDVPQDVVDALKRRATENGRSAEAEHRLILEQALRPGRADFWERAAAQRLDDILGQIAHQQLGHRGNLFAIMP